MFSAADDWLIKTIFNPVAEWTFAEFGVSNYRLARHFCTIAIIALLYGIYYYIVRHKYTDAALYLIVLTAFSIGWRVTHREDASAPAGTASPFRFAIAVRIMAVFSAIVITLVLDSPLFAVVIANAGLLALYFLACDKPKGDRLAAFKADSV